MTDKLSLEGLNFQATKLNIANNVLTLTLNRPAITICGQTPLSISGAENFAFSTAIA